jgi:hypothetical protein
MKISGPDQYTLNFTAEQYAVICRRGRPHFSGIATKRVPKLYVASSEGKPVYVGQTVQPMRDRLRLGWKADGKDGYHGYAWRHQLTTAQLNVWSHDDAVEGPNWHRDIETIEAEIVFLIRHLTGNWPMFQTEIHFYPSRSEHRRIAQSILSTYMNVDLATAEVHRLAGWPHITSAPPPSPSSPAPTSPPRSPAARSRTAPSARSPA